MQGMWCCKGGSTVLTGAKWFRVTSLRSEDSLGVSEGKTWSYKGGKVNHADGECANREREGTFKNLGYRSGGGQITKSLVRMYLGLILNN